MISERFDRAVLLAVRLHRNQKRKGSAVPYLAHLFAVTAIVLEHGGNENEAIAALLHDSLEDQGGEQTRIEIMKQFGPSVCGIVEGCSEPFHTPKLPWRERKEHYLAQLKPASPSVRLVSAADKLHNSRSLLDDYYRIGDRLWDRFNGGKEGTLWFYRALVNEYANRGPDSLAQKIAHTVGQLEDLANN